jgi:hypothetical protein
MSKMKSVQKQRGQVIVLVALAMTVLLGFLGLATDVGMLWAVRRKAQTAADAAAGAGLDAVLVGQSSGYSSAATDVATINGFTNGTQNTTVAVSEPTGTGCPAGTCVQVTITKTVQTYFLGALGFRSIPVSVSANAFGTSGPNTIVATNTSGSGVTINGPTVNVSCGIVSNSNLTVTNGGSVTAGSVSVVGTTHGSVPSNTKTGCSPVQNPFSSWHSPTPSSCSRQSTNNTGTNTITTTCTVPSNLVYDGGSGSSPCGHTISNYNSHTRSYPAITVSFSGGTCGNHISCGGSNQPTCQNVTCNFSPGQYQCVNTSNGGWWGRATPGFMYAAAEALDGDWGNASIGFLRTGGTDQWGGRFEKIGGGGYGYGRTVTPSIEIGPHASGCTANFSSGSYTFLGNVSICGANTVNLQPGTYCGGITIADDSNGNSPTVNFAPGTYICGGGGLNVSGHCTLSGTGCTFHNTADTSSDGYSNGTISCGANSGDSVHCNLSAPTSGSCKGMLFTQDSSVSGGTPHGWGWSSGSGNCTIKCDSTSTVDGSCYIPGASCSFSGNSSTHGYTIIVADSVTLTGNTRQTHKCDYSSLSNGLGPIQTSALYK